MKTIFRIIFIVALMASCGKGEISNARYRTVQERIANEIQLEQAPEDQSSEPEVSLQNPVINKKKIIKDGRMTLKVADIEKSKKRVDELVKKQEGYYANESYNNTDYESSFQLKIRIPAGNYEKFINDLESGDDEIEYKEINARDVTDQYLDLETRLNNKKTYLNRYQDLVKQANKIQDILDIEEKIRVLEEEIESTTGRLKYLGDQVDYSTLDLTITRKKEFIYNPAVRGKFTEKLKQSLSKGWFGFVDFLLFLIRIWPVWIIGGATWYFLRRHRRRRSSQKITQKS